MENWQLLAGIGGSIVAFFGGQKMKTIQEKKANSDAVLSMQTVYDNFVKDIESRYADMRDQMQEVRSEVILLRKENGELRKELRNWERKYYDLKAEFDKIKN
jgi:predicted  nucleic acid-binding Zn-ribbon protein